MRTLFFRSPHCHSFRLLWCILLWASMVTAAGAARLEEESGQGAGDEAEIVPVTLFSGLKYRHVGPSRGGRVTAVAGHSSQPGTFYMGATGGGVWKTTNFGQTWHPVSDGYFATGSIGAIQVSASNPDIVYVGTGSDGLRSNVIIGKGVYKSTDGGETWKHLGLEKSGNIGAILIHPDNPDLVYVAAIGNPFAPNPERGVFRSRDGGANWEKVLFISEQTGAVDLEFAPFNPKEIYAAMWRAERKPWTIISGGREGGLYKSNDAGNSWGELTDGLPKGLRGKADLAVSPADPDRVYVLIEAPAKEGGLYRSDDRGKSWEQVTDFQPIRNRPFYYTNLEAHPSNADILWGMAEGFWKSEDGGRNWKSMSTPHGDNHDMWINPNHPEIFIQANDGGANVTLDGGRTWSTQKNQPTAELYQVDVSDEFPYRLYAGQQDNTTISVPSRPAMTMPGGPTALWESHGGCETGPAVPKPGDPDIVYANCKGRFGVYNRRTGQEQQAYVGFEYLYGHNPRDLEFRFQRVAPIEVSPHDPNRVYHGSQFVHVTTDGGQTWEIISPDLTAFPADKQVVPGEPITLDVTGEEYFSTLYVIEESPHQEGVIWAGANDGPVHVTRDGGKHWQNATPPDLDPYGRVQSIEISPHNPAVAYVCILRYQLGDFGPYVFKTENYGRSWTRLTTGDNGIPPDFPVRVVREDPNREGLLYAGTEFGMFISFDHGSRWQPFQLNLPVTPVTDLELVENDLVLSTMGRGFWILYDRSPLYEASTQLAAKKIHLYSVSDAFRLYPSRAGGGAGAPDYPRPGATITYFLAEDTQDELQIEILDSRGTLIRSFTSDGEKAKAKNVTSLTEPSPWSGSPPSPPPQLLPASAGLHRWIWDLRYAGPWGDGAARSGPMVAPGRYEVRMTAGSIRSTHHFQVLMDPRVTDAGITDEDVQLQLNLAIQVRDAISDARRAAVSVIEKLKAEGEAGKEELLKIQQRLITPAERYAEPQLIDRLRYLYSSLIRSDQKPPQHAMDRFQKLKSELDSILQALDTD